MKKADYKFHRDRKKQIQNQSRENDVLPFWHYSQPIFIPKRKKKK